MWSDYLKIRGYSGNPDFGVDPGIFEVFQGIGPAAGSNGGNGGTDLTPVTAQLQAIANKLGAEGDPTVANAIAELEVGSAGGAVDLTPVTAQLQAIGTKLGEETAQLQAIGNKLGGAGDPTIAHAIAEDGGTNGGAVDLTPVTAKLGNIVTELQNIVAVMQHTNPEIGVEGLQQWLTAINAWMIDEEQWLDATIAYSEQEGSRGDLPAPMPPPLPDLTSFLSLPALIAQFGPWGIVIWVGIKVIKRLIEAWIEKRMNPGVGDLKEMLQDIRDAIKKGLLYNNGTDSILLKAFLGEDFKSYLASLPDLAYIDHIIDFGAFRCYIKGKMIEY